MKSNLLMDFSVDRENKTISINREFAAELPMVWDAFTKSEILDQWWAPKPWKAITKIMDFKNGGNWLYAMTGPNGEEHWSRVDFEKIIFQNSFRGRDGFTDKDGNLNLEIGVSVWDVSFSSKGDQTLVTIQISFDSPDQLETLIKMGFKEGMTMAMENLDGIFSRK